MNIKEVLDKSIKFLSEKKVENSRFEAEFLLQNLLNYNSRVDLYLNFDKPLNEKETDLYRQYIVRKSKNEPSAYILGYKWFYNYKFAVSSSVLIPRPETEYLVEKSVQKAEELISNNSDIEAVRLADFGSGSGCIGISTTLELAKKFPDLNFEIDFYEVSKDAVLILDRNIKNLFVSVKNISFQILQIDLNEVQKLDNQYDLIMANPPYIENNSDRVEKHVHDFEPHLALYSGPTGFECVETWSSLAIASLKKGGFFGFEIAEQQIDQVIKLLEKYGELCDIQVIKDQDSKSRAISAKKKS